MNRALLIPLFFSLAILLASCAAYGIFYSIVQAEGAKAEQLETEITAANNATAQAAQAKEEMSQLGSEQGTVTQYFVSTTNIVPFLEQLQSIGNYLGANVQVASVSANSAAPYGTLDLSLSITGPFDSVLRTLGAIEFEPYNVSLTSLSLNTSNTPASSSTLPSWSAAGTFIVGAQTGTAGSTTPSTATPLNELNTFGLPPTTNQPGPNQSTSSSTSALSASSSPDTSSSSTSTASSSVEHPTLSP